MEQLKQAYELLAVSEDADQGEIEDRYYLLLRRHKSNIKDLSSTDRTIAEEEFEKITKAYQMIKGHLQQKNLENNPLYQAEQKKSPFRRKIENFFFHYRLHVFIGVIVFGLVASFVYTIVTKEKEIPADVSTMMVGAYYAEDFKPLEGRMTELVPEWERVAVIENRTPNLESADAMLDAALIQKSMAILASERPDIYIVDQWQFERLGDQTAFLPLDDYEEKLRALVGEDRLMYAQFAEDDKTHLYGIDLTDSPVFEGITIDRLPKIFTIRNYIEDESKGLQLIEAMAKQLHE